MASTEYFHLFSSLCNLLNIERVLHFFVLSFWHSFVLNHRFLDIHSFVQSFELNIYSFIPGIHLFLVFFHSFIYSFILSAYTFNDSSLILISSFLSLFSFLHSLNHTFIPSYLHTFIPSIIPSFLWLTVLKYSLNCMALSRCPVGTEELTRFGT